MLGDTSINFISIASRKEIRKWVVSEVEYDFDYDGHCSHKLGENEYCEFGTPFAAYNHAKSLVNKYRKKWSDVRVVIKEVCVDGGNL